MSAPIIINFTSPSSSISLTFEDDGKVAYAYLKREEEIIGAVWLYNVCPTPSAPEWKDKSNLPFALSNGYASQHAQLKKMVSDKDIIVDWDKDDNGLVAYIYIFEDLYGVIGENEKIGYARHASKDSPLALVMEIED